MSRFATTICLPLLALLLIPPAAAQPTFNEDLARQRSEQQSSEEFAQLQRERAAADEEADAESGSTPTYSRPRQWLTFAAAVAWGDSKSGVEFVVAENILMNTQPELMPCNGVLPKVGETARLLFRLRMA